jgi:RNA polymerase sigma factor (sigma-70 family)
MVSTEKPHKSSWLNQIPTQTALLRRVGAEDPRSWEDFYQMYSGPSLIYLKARNVPQADAEDIVQAIMLKAPHIVGRYLIKERRQRFRYYLATALRNSHLDLERKSYETKHELMSAPKSSDEHKITSKERPDEQLEFTEKELEAEAMRQWAESFVRQLKPKQQKLYKLWREGVLTKKMTWHDVAECLGEKKSTLRSRHKKVMDDLQQELKRHFPENHFQA